MDKWEYKQFTASHLQEARPGLNKLGHEGWECFAAIADHQYTYFYLKRRVESK